MRLDIQSNSLQLEPWINELYVSNDLTSQLHLRSAPIQLHVESKGGPHQIRLTPKGDAIFAETNLCGGRCYYRDGMFFSSGNGDYEHEMEYDLQSGTIRVNVGGKYQVNGQALISNLLRPILQSFLLPFHNLKTLHGALLTKNGETLFLSGRGGAGKTTTAVQFANSGYEVLSDDGPIFTLHNGNALALSSLDYLHFTENTLNLFPELNAYVVGQKDSRDKFAIALRKLSTGKAWMKPHKITRFIELRRQAEVKHPAIKSISKSRVLRDLLNDSMVIFRRAPFSGDAVFKRYSDFIFDLIVNVIEHAEVYSVEYSDHHLRDLPALLD